MVPQWAPKWRQLGTQLKFNHYLMDIIEHDHPYDCETCCSKMFSEWLDINPDASWEDIIHAVDNLLSDGMCVSINMYIYLIHERPGYTKYCS